MQCRTCMQLTKSRHHLCRGYLTGALRSNPVIGRAVHGGGADMVISRDNEDCQRIENRRQHGWGESGLESIRSAPQCIPIVVANHVEHTQQRAIGRCIADGI